ncbi:MAG TPA: HAMP domain-containing sensor histidine kinase [Gaiellaceae bacterium]
MKRPGSLRTRLFLAIGLIVVLSVGLTLAIGVVLTRPAVDNAILDDVAHQAGLLAEREGKALLPCSQLAGLSPDLARQNEIVRCPRLDRPSRYLDSRQIVDVRRRPLRDIVRIDGRDYYMAATRVPGNVPLRKQKAVVIMRPRGLGGVWAPFVKALLIAAAVGATLAAIASFLFARVIARPIGRVAAASRDLARGGSPAPVPAEGAEELATLATSFNELSEQLARAKAAERSFLLSVSHELKTPLTAIRGYAEGIADGAVDSGEAASTIGREADRLERLVGDLLDLARMNRSEFSIRSGELDLAEIADEALSRYLAQARSFGVDLTAAGSSPAPAIGDPDRVLQIVSNLVENALRLTPPGGSVTVAAEPGSLTVEDTGPGLSPEELPRAFERFYLYSRYGRERPVGTGLGLAIVKELTEAMGGTVEVRSAPAEPTAFVVKLPRPATAPFRPVPALIEHD